MEKPVTTTERLRFYVWVRDLMVTQGDTAEQYIRLAEHAQENLQMTPAIMRPGDIESLALIACLALNDLLDWFRVAGISAEMEWQGRHREMRAKQQELLRRYRLIFPS